MLGRGGWFVARNGRFTAPLLLLALSLAPAAVEAAILESVTSNYVILPASAAATNVALPGVDISRAFVVCTSETLNTDPSRALATCELNNNGSGGAAQLSITPGAAPAATTIAVFYHVAEFVAGVSVQRGTTTFSGTALTPSSTPSLSAVECTKSFAITSVRSTSTSTTTDEHWLIRAILGTGASPCVSGTTTSLELSRNEGANGVTVTVAWQVVTLEGAAVQRGLSCIGGGTNCTTNAGGTAGVSNRVTLGTAVDTSKSFILFTRKGGTAIAGVEGEYNMRAQFAATGASVTGVEFRRSRTVTTSNHHLDIAYEVVSLSDGSTVQSSGTTPTTLGAGSTSATATLSTVDTTRTAVFYSTSGGDNGTTRIPATFVGVYLNGANGAGGSSLSFDRASSAIGAVSTAWFAVSFFRCATPSGVTYDTVCTVGASTTGTAATVNWASVNPVLILESTSTITATPANGTTYSVGNTIGGVPVVYSGTTASDTSFSDTGLTTGTTYYYKVWAVAGPAGSCTTAPCYTAGTQASVTPRSGSTTWSSIVVGGAALNPAVSGSGRMSLGSNNAKMISLDSTTGAWASVPAATVGAVQGYLSVFGATEQVVGGDQKGWIYSIDPATGSYNWIRQLSADAFQAAVSTYLRGWFSPAMASAYPGSYDIIFAATMNTALTSNKVFALRSDTGAILWTFDPATLDTAPCVGGCPMDQVVGQPWVDYLNDRLYVTSGPGAGGTQKSVWSLDLTNDGALLSVLGSGADFVTSPSQSFYAGDKLYVGDEAGLLHIIDLATPTLADTTNAAASGTAFKGFVWEDFAVEERLYFVTTDGNVWCLQLPSTTPCWKTKPVAAGTVSQILLGDGRLWAGGSDGKIYQLSSATGVVETSFTVGGGTLGLGPISTETGGELYVTTTDGRLYKIALDAQGSLP